MTGSGTDQIDFFLSVAPFPWGSILVPILLLLAFRYVGGAQQQHQRNRAALPNDAIGKENGSSFKLQKDNIWVVFLADGSFLEQHHDRFLL